MCFWVFDVGYPEDLRLFYTFTEKLLGLLKNLYFTVSDVTTKNILRHFNEHHNRYF